MDGLESRGRSKGCDQGKGGTANRAAGDRRAPEALPETEKKGAEQELRWKNEDVRVRRIGSEMSRGSVEIEVLDTIDRGASPGAQIRER